MSDENELHGTPSPGDTGTGRPADHSAARPQPDAPLPVDDSSGDAESRDDGSGYDVSGAALGALDPTEDADLYAAASVDPAVSAELAAMEAVSAELARLAPETPMNRGRSAGIRSRLVARAAATRTGRPVSRAAAPEEGEHHVVRPAARPVSRPASHHPAAAASYRLHSSAPSGGAAAAARHEAGAHHVIIPFERPQRPGLGRIVGGLALAAAVAVAAFGIYTFRSNSVSTPAGASAAAQDSSLAAQVASLRASVAQKDSVIAGLTGMHTRVIDLVSVSSADPMGKVFWNQEQQTFVMYASNLKPPAAGKTYQVWLIARGGAPPMSAGTFVPDATGSAVMTTRNPVQPGALRREAVTEEAAGGATAPTGPVLFSGVGR
jgi:hypothetical protein